MKRPVCVNESSAVQWHITRELPTTFYYVFFCCYSLRILRFASSTGRNSRATVRTTVADYYSHISRSRTQAKLCSVGAQFEHNYHAARSSRSSPYFREFRAKEWTLNRSRQCGSARTLRTQSMNADERTYEAVIGHDRNSSERKTKKHHIYGHITNRIAQNCKYKIIPPFRMPWTTNCLNVYFGSAAVSVCHEWLFFLSFSISPVWVCVVLHSTYSLLLHFPRNECILWGDPCSINCPNNSYTPGTRLCTLHLRLRISRR